MFLEGGRGDAKTGVAMAAPGAGPVLVYSTITGSYSSLAFVHSSILYIIWSAYRRIRSITTHRLQQPHI